METISNIGLEVIDEHQLDEYIYAAAEIVANEDGYESLSEFVDESSICMGEILVICEILGELKGKDADAHVDTYIDGVLKQKEEKENAEEHELYLKLKEKFEFSKSDPVYETIQEMLSLLLDLKF